MENQLTQDNIKKDAIPVEEAFSNMSPVKTGATATVPQPNPLDFTGMIQEQQQIAKDTGNARDSQLNSIASAFNRISGLPQAQLQMEKDAGIQNMQQDLQQYDSMIALKNRDYTNQYRALEERGSSLSSIRGRQNQLNTQATREMADLAIIRDSKAGRLDLAKQWVDKKIQAETAQARSQLEATQFFYNENKEVLTKAQDRAFSLKIADQEKKLADEKELRTAVNNIALQSAQYGATPDVVSQIGNAKTHKEAIALASKYLGEPFRLQVDMAEFDKRIKSAQLSIQQQELALKRGETVAKTAKEIQAIADKEKATLESAKGTVGKIDELLGKTSGIRAAAGTTALGRINRTTPDTLAERREVTAIAANILDAGWLKEIIDAKGQGTSFGSLTESEGQKLYNIVSPLANTVIKNKDGQITGFRSTPEFVIAEMNKLKQASQEILNSDKTVPQTSDSFVESLSTVIPQTPNAFSAIGLTY